MNSNIKKYTGAIFLSLAALTAVSCGEKENPAGGNKGDGSGSGQKTYLPEWEEGYMDIHHIATGKGDCVFVVMPDGTTMLQDAGDVGDPYGASDCDRLPDRTKTAGEWIADYINHFSAKLPSPGVVDYAWITHFHSDHVGSTSCGVMGDNGYYLSGLTMVGEKVQIKKLVDRAYPSYDFPSTKKIEQEFPLFQDYKMFTSYQTGKGMKAEKFAIGSKTQFTLVHDAEKYPEFEVRNLCANGEIWTGRGTATTKMYSGDIYKFDENMNSCAIKMTYGKFSYFNGGDLPGKNLSQYQSTERNFEIPMSEIAGPVTALTPNHHGWKESTTAEFLKNMKPEVIAVMSNHIEHPHSSTMANMTSDMIWPGERNIYVTSDSPKRHLGNAFSSFKGTGHIVIRVFKGGTAYQVYVLDAKEKDYHVTYMSKIKFLEK